MDSCEGPDAEYRCEDHGHQCDHGLRCDDDASGGDRRRSQGGRESADGGRYQETAPRNRVGRNHPISIYSYIQKYGLL